MNFRSAEAALVYLTDCTLATVSAMALRAKPPVGEFARQIAIAQRGLDAARECGAMLSSRPRDVAEKFGGSVRAWAEAIIARRKP